VSEDRARMRGSRKGAARVPGRILYNSAQIASAVHELAKKIEERLEGRAPTLLILLKGGARFGCDLIRALPGEVNFDFLGVSSYGNNLLSSGTVDFYLYRPARELIDSRPVVLVDDICDSGTTFSAVSERLRRDFNPEVLLSCSLIWREGAGFTPDFRGFHYSGDEFLVGYGLGAGELHRELEEIVILEQSGN
jgi:hypoxanthine phosphoribosyltransferase